MEDCVGDTCSVTVFLQHETLFVKYIFPLTQQIGTDVLLFIHSYPITHQIIHAHYARPICGTPCLLPLIAQRHIYKCTSITAYRLQTIVFSYLPHPKPYLTCYIPTYPDVYSSSSKMPKQFANVLYSTIASLFPLTMVASSHITCTMCDLNI